MPWRNGVPPATRTLSPGVWLSPCTIALRLTTREPPRWGGRLSVGTRNNQSEGCTSQKGCTDVKNPTRHQAVRSTLALDRAQYDIRAQCWIQVHALLMVIAEHYPYAMPGQKRIAKELGRSVPTVQRYLRMAVEAGLVDVIPDSGKGGHHGHWRTNTYRLRYLHRASSVMPRPGITSDAQSNPPKGGLAEEKKVSPSSPRKELAKPPAAVSQQRNSQAEGGSMVSKWKDDPDNPANWTREQAIGEPDEPPPTRVVSIDPAARLARLFEDLWKEEVLRASPGYRGTRIVEPGKAIPYLKTRMLTHMSYEHVEAYMASFMQAVIHDETELRPGQGAFEHFTTWWGRVEVPDPAQTKQERALGNWMIAEARRQRARKSRRGT